MWSVRRGNAVAKSLHGEFVSGNYFSTLGIGAYAGRVFSRQRRHALRRSPQSCSATRHGRANMPPIPPSSAPPSSFRPGPSPSSASRRRASSATASSDTPPDFWMPLQTEPYVRGDSSILHHQRLPLALSDGQSAPRNQHRRVAGQAYRSAAPVALYAPAAHRQRRSGHHSQAACGPRHPAAAAFRTCSRRRARV